MKIRYIAKHIALYSGSKQMVWRVYDTERAAYPSVLSGRRIEDHFQTEAAAQKVADELNKEVTT